jgi:hypothetical protein
VRRNPLQMTARQPFAVHEMGRHAEAHEPGGVSSNRLTATSGQADSRRSRSSGT